MTRKGEADYFATITNIFNEGQNPQNVQNQTLMLYLSEKWSYQIQLLV